MISNYIIPIVIFLIVFWGLKDRLNVFDLFVEGAKEGIIISIKLLPTLMGLFLAISLLRNSGFFELIVYIIKPIFNLFNVPTELIPLFFIRPISGSGAIAVATDIMNTYGVDSFVGKAASIIMGSTETTLYTFAIYTSGLKVNKTKDVIIAALLADIVGMSISVVFCRIWS